MNILQRRTWLSASLKCCSKAITPGAQAIFVLASLEKRSSSPLSHALLIHRQEPFYHQGAPALRDREAEWRLAAGLQTHAAQLPGRGISEGGIDHSQPADGERSSQPLQCGNYASFLRLAPGLFCGGGKGKRGRWLLVYSARPNGFPKDTIARFCCGTMASVSASLLADSWGAPVPARLSRPWALCSAATSVGGDENAPVLSSLHSPGAVGFSRGR